MIEGWRNLGHSSVVDVTAVCAVHPCTLLIYDNDFWP